MNFVTRRKEAERIDFENARLMDKIITSHSPLNQFEVKKSYEKLIDYKKRRNASQAAHKQEQFLAKQRENHMRSLRNPRGMSRTNFYKQQALYHEMKQEFDALPPEILEQYKTINAKPTKLPRLDNRQGS